MEAVMGYTFYFQFEVIFMEMLQRLFGGAAISVISFFSSFGEEMILVLIMGFLYWGIDKKMGTFVGYSILLGCVMNPLVKNIAMRRRPYFDNPQIKCLRPVDKEANIYNISAQGYSFPSGHSCNSVTCYSSIAVYQKKKIFFYIAILVPLLVGLSRMAVGVHYPTDVLVGWLFGLLIVGFVTLLDKKVPEEKRGIVNLVIFLIACVGFFYCKTDDYYSSMGLMGGFFLSLEFDKRFVDFKNTKKPLRVIVRVLCGAAIFFAMNKVLKLPFSSEFLESPTFYAYFVRFFRYFLALFVAVGVYPMAFAPMDKIWKDEH